MYIKSKNDIFIRGVTDYKIHGSVRYDTVVSRFGTFSIRGGGGGDCLCRNVGNISVLNHEDEPMDITQARVCTIYAGVHLNLSQFTLNRK